MTPFAEGTLAAARKELEACVEEIKRACSAREPDSWRHVALAHTHAIVALARVNDAVELEAMAEKRSA